jgi:putative ABC transport system permease protein
VRQLPGVEHITGRFYMWGEFTVSFGDKHAAFDVRSVHPDHKYIENTIVTRGRYLNDLDIEQQRKVAVIGQAVADFLFGPTDPLGHTIDIRGIAYRVIGVFRDVGGEGELRKIFVPISTAQMAYSGGDRIHALIFTVGDMTAEDSKHLEAKVNELLAARHDYSPEDKRALEVRNNLEQYAKVMSIFDAIQVFVWIVGAGTIVAGIVGVSNIMMISVRERTKEFGVRKALGATPSSIIALVVQESIVLTAVSGYIGMVAGIAGLELAGNFVEHARAAQVDLRIALIATGLLVFFGALAGYFPARSAASVDPVVALRDE